MQNYFSILCLLIMLLKSIAGIPTADIMKKYNGLIEVDTCKFNTSQVSIMFNCYKKDYDHPLQITKFFYNELETYKVKLASNYVNRPPALIGSLGKIWFIYSMQYLPEEEFFDFVVKRGDEWRPILFFFYSDYVQLLAIDDVTKKRVVLVLVIDSTILENFWQRWISSTPKHNEPFGNELELQCKEVEISTPKKQIIYLPHGTALLIQNKENDLMCNSAYYLPQKLRVTFINYLNFSYCKGTINLYKFNYTKDKCYYYAFNTDLNKIYFAKSFAVLQNNAPNFRSPKFISDSFQTFLYVNHIFIISGGWVFYFRFLDMDYNAWNNLKGREVIATELSVMHIGQFYRCEPGGQQKQETFTKEDYYYEKIKAPKKDITKKTKATTTIRTTTMGQMKGKDILNDAKYKQDYLDQKHREETERAKAEKDKKDKGNIYQRYFGLAVLVVMVVLIGIGLIICFRPEKPPELRTPTLSSIYSNIGRSASSASTLGMPHLESRSSAGSFLEKHKLRGRSSAVSFLEKHKLRGRSSATSFLEKHKLRGGSSATSFLEKHKLKGGSSTVSSLEKHKLRGRSSATSFLEKHKLRSYHQSSPTSKQN